MVAFSLNRYALVCKPFTHYKITSRKSTVIQILSLAVTAFIANMAGFIIQDMRYLWILILVKIIMVFFAPLIITFILTVLVLRELNRNHGISMRTALSQAQKNITKATNMAYVLLVLPICISAAVNLFTETNISPLKDSILVLYYSNFTINIFIYTLFLPKFKSTLLGFFQCKCSKRNRDEFARMSTHSSVEMQQVLP